MKNAKAILIQSLGYGGAERVASELLKSGLLDYVIILENKVAYDVPSEKIILIDSPSSRNIIKKFVKLAIRYYKIKKVKKAYNIGLYLGMYEPANLLAAITKGNTKVILSFHSNYTLDFNKSPFMGQGIIKKLMYIMYRLAMKFFYNRVELMVAVSKDVKDDLVKNFGLKEEKIKVIYNPLDIESIRAKSTETLGEFDKVFTSPVIITAGRLTKQKGHWYLLRVFKEVKKEILDLKLVILGDGELKNYLVSLSKSLGLKTYVWDRNELSENYDVYFLGFQENPFKFLSRAKLFVFPSLWEGFGNVITESMACGLPVISSDCRSGPREILAPNTDFRYQTDKPEFAEYGILMPVFDGKFKKAEEPLDAVERMWAETLKSVLKDENILNHYRQMALKRAEDFSMIKIIKEWESILNDLSVSSGGENSDRRFA